MKAFLASLLLLTLGCGPKCLKSHSVPTFIPGYFEDFCTMRDNNSGMCTFSVPLWHDGYMGTKTVCDEYEVEKKS